MLMPQKHIDLYESLIGLGAIIITIIGKNSKTLDTIIEKVNLWIEKNKIKKIYNNIDNILLSIDYLFSIGAIDMNEEGGIYNVLTRS